VRDVPADGRLGDPATDCDVVRYDFKLFPGYGGYPGDGGATVLAGHVDYSLAHEGGTGAVVGVGQYWKQLKKGDTIQYQRGDGKVITYQVSWTAPVPLGSDFDYSTLARQTSTETLALITCGGTWNAAAHEYEERTVVYALRVNQ
jgi:LPXTG-site transpeptidase (sortase) family protein